MWEWINSDLWQTVTSQHFESVLAAGTHKRKPETSTSYRRNRLSGVWLCCTNKHIIAYIIWRGLQVIEDRHQITKDILNLNICHLLCYTLSRHQRDTGTGISFHHLHLNLSALAKLSVSTKTVLVETPKDNRVINSCLFYLADHSSRFLFSSLVSRVEYLCHALMSVIDRPVQSMRKKTTKHSMTKLKKKDSNFLFNGFKMSDWEHKLCREVFTRLETELLSHVLQKTFRVVVFSFLRAQLSPSVGLQLECTFKAFPHWLHF